MQPNKQEKKNNPVSQTRALIKICKALDSCLWCITRKTQSNQSRSRICDSSMKAMPLDQVPTPLFTYFVSPKHLRKRQLIFAVRHTCFWLEHFTSKLAGVTFLGGRRGSSQSWALFHQSGSCVLPHTQILPSL